MFHTPFDFQKFSKIFENIPIFRKPFSKFRNNNFQKYQEKIFEIFRKSTNTILELIQKFFKKKFLIISSNQKYFKTN